MNNGCSRPQSSFSICTFYHLADLFLVLFGESASLDVLRADLNDICIEEEIKGTILVANDGINGTISGLYCNVKKIVDFLCMRLSVDQIFEIKYSICEFIPFSKLKILIRNEVVSLKSDCVLNENLRATDVDANSWDEFIERSDVQLLDVRNGYEFKLGTFEKSVNFNTVNFRDFKDAVKLAIDSGKIDINKKTAIFCQGDIRCEKGGVYMKNIGFKNVFKLKGGILRYFEKTKNVGKKWLGDCFVFDDRVTIDSNLRPGKLRCIHCLSLINNLEDRRSITKGRVVCSYCKNEKLKSLAA